MTAAGSRLPWLAWFVKCTAASAARAGAQALDALPTTTIVSPPSATPMLFVGSAQPARQDFMPTGGDERTGRPVQYSHDIACRLQRTRVVACCCCSCSCRTDRRESWEAMRVGYFGTAPIKRAERRNETSMLEAVDMATQMVHRGWSGSCRGFRSDRAELSDRVTSRFLSAR